MLTNIVSGLVVLIGMTYVVQWLVPSARGRPGASRRFIRNDLAPILAFFGLVLLVLSFLEAERRASILAWGLGSAFGLIAAAVVGIAMVYLMSAPRPQPARRASSLRIALRIVRTYGLIILAALVGLNLAIRYFGAAVEVFLAGALAIFVIGTAAVVYTRVARSRENGEDT